MNKQIRLFVLLSFIAFFAVAKSSDSSSDSDSVIYSYSYSDSDSDSDSSSSDEVNDVQLRNRAREVINKYRKQEKKKEKQKTEEKAKAVQPLSFELMFINQVARDLESHVIKVPAADKKDVRHVKLSTLAIVLHDAATAKNEPPTIAAPSVEGETLLLPTTTAKKTVVNAVVRVVYKAERAMERAMMQYTNEHPEDVRTGNKVIKMMFKKIYGNERADAQRKAFARVEEAMHVSIGSIYTQYLAGVEVPRLPSQIIKDRQDTLKYTLDHIDNRAGVRTLYDSLHGMNLSREQEIPEHMLKTINRELQKQAKEKEEPEKPIDIKTFFLGD